MVAAPHKAARGSHNLTHRPSRGNREALDTGRPEAASEEPEGTINPLDPTANRLGMVAEAELGSLAQAEWRLGWGILPLQAPNRKP